MRSQKDILKIFFLVANEYEDQEIGFGDLLFFVYFSYYNTLFCLSMIIKVSVPFLKKKKKFKSTCMLGLDV